MDNALAIAAPFESPAPILSTSGERCFACGRRLGATAIVVDTRDGQTPAVGSECYKLIVAFGEAGYQPPKGGPRLWLLPLPILSVCCYMHPGCEKPRSNAPAGYRLSDGICNSCLSVERAKNMLARTSRKVAR